MQRATLPHPSIQHDRVAAASISPPPATQMSAIAMRLWGHPAVRTGIAAPFLAITLPIATFLRYDAWPNSIEPSEFVALLTLGVVLKLATFWSFGIFRIRTRYLSLEDLFLIVQATLFAALAFALLGTNAPIEGSLGRSVWLIDWGLTLAGCCTAQVIRRMFAERRRLQRQDRKSARRTLIVGSEQVGETMLHAIRREGQHPFAPVGFITSSPRPQTPIGSTIGGVKVVGTLDEACDVGRRLLAEVLVVTAGDLSGQAMRRLMTDAEQSNMKVTVLPSYRQLLTGEVSLQPREVSIEDLLQRDPVELDASRISQWLAGRRVMVTGSSGSIGSEVCRQLIRFDPACLILVDQNETGQFFLERELLDLTDGREIELRTLIGDVADAGRMDRVFREQRPEIIFHAAAYKHVPLMEAHGCEAVKTNILGSRLLAELADRYRAESFVMVSTDKAVRPTSRMGASKRVAELFVQSLAERSQTRFVTVRFGNVLGSAGSVVPIFRQQIAAGGPVTVTHPDMTRFFMTIPEAAQLIVQAGGQGRGGEIFVLDMGEPVRVLSLAEDMIRLSGLQPYEEIEVAFTGTRPGEKITEELYTDGERQRPTEHAKILVAESEQINALVVRNAISELADPENWDNDRIDSILASLIPNYRQFTLEAGTLTATATIEFPGVRRRHDRDGSRRAA